MVDIEEIQAGFKQTEVGLIPEDWAICPLNQVANFQNGKAHERFIDEYGEYIVVNSKFISTEGDVKKYSKIDMLPLKKGDITIVMSDIPNGKALAKCFLIDSDDKYTLNQRIGGITVKDEVDNQYLCYKLNRNKYYLAFDSGTGQTNIKRQEILDCPVALPPTKAEQTTIATALSDIDALIETQQQLIDKKRAIKEGAMQELLKTKEGWDTKTLFEIADNNKEIFDDGDWIESEHITDNGIRLVQTGNIGIGRFVEKENRKYVLHKSFEKLNCKELHIGDLLICRLADPAGRACVLPNIGEDISITSVDVTIFRPRKDVANRVFLANLFSTTNWFQKVIERVGGTTHKRISRSALGKIEVSIPIVEEQTRIASILSDMDAEIDQLETQLSKYRQIKVGMMQDLLTGRKRLIQPNTKPGGKVFSIKPSTNKKHNWQFNEAVVISVLAYVFGKDHFPLGRKRYTKMSYLMHRYAERQAEGYLKKAAGPYNPATRYKGPEAIAQRNNYIKIAKSGKFSGFVADKNINTALEYFEKWYGMEIIQWLEQFRFEKNDTLELWATVDMAMQDLKEDEKEVSLETIKALINDTKEWRPKLKREAFSDEKIAEAISKSNELFGI